MTAVIHFRPLCGAKNEEPFMYLLTIDECKILLDCGWNDSFDLKLLEPLKAYVFLCGWEGHLPWRASSLIET